MKKFNIIYIGIIILLTSLLVMSCEKEIDVDLKSVEPKIVIEGLIVKDSIAKVHITRTKDFYDDNNFPPVSGAIVTVSDEDGNSEILEQNRQGVYVSRSLIGKENITYYLNVKIEGKEYTASSTMPELVQIDTITMYYIPTPKYAMPMVVISDPAGTKNYYRSLLYLNRIRMDIGNETTDDKQRDGTKIERILFVADDDKENRRKVEKGDTVLIELQTIDKGAFDFFNSLGMMDATENNPTTNIIGGALGYFSAYTIDKKQIIADW